MADLNIQNNKENLRHKRMAPQVKVDFTAMVDLGFLLITFFMLATEFSRDNKMVDVVNPIEDTTVTADPIPVSRTLSLLIGSSKKVFYFSQPDKILDPTEVRFDSADFGAKGLRKVILQKQDEIELKFGTKDKLFILVKPLVNSKFQNFVHVLDEIRITNVKNYCILKPDEEVDRIILHQLNLRNN